MTLPGTNGFFVTTYEYELENYSHTGYTYDYGGGPCQYFVTDSVTEEEEKDKVSYVLPYDGLPFVFRMCAINGPSEEHYDYESAMLKILGNVPPSQIYHRDENMFVFYDKSLIDFVDIVDIDESHLQFDQRDCGLTIITTVDDIEYECERIDIFKEYPDDSGSSSYADSS